MQEVIFALLLALVGCEPPAVYPCIETQHAPRVLYIDTGCNESDGVAIRDAVDRLNETTCAPVVLVDGPIDANEFTDVDAVLCYHTEPPWYQDTQYANLLGACSRRDPKTIRLFLFRTPESCVLPLVMHELGHYVGVHAHAENIHSVMYPYIQAFNTEYSREDRELLLQSEGL